MKAQILQLLRRHLRSPGYHLAHYCLVPYPPPLVPLMGSRVGQGRSWWCEPYLGPSLSGPALCWMQASGGTSSTRTLHRETLSTWMGQFAVRWT